MQPLALALALVQVTGDHVIRPPDYDQVIAIEVPSAPLSSASVVEAPLVEVPAPPRVPVPPPPVLEVDPVNYRIVLAGDVLIGASGIGLVLLGAGLVVGNDAITQRDAQQVALLPDLDEIAKQERRLVLGNTLALVGGVSAAVLMGAGIGLIIGGRARERRRREALVLRPSAGGLLLRF